MSTTTAWRSDSSPGCLNIIIMDRTCYTERVSGGTRLYYIDACRDKNGVCYISVSDIPTKAGLSKKGRQRIYIYERDIEKFAAAFARVSNHIKSKGNG